jgi:predicted phage-related endonuclease
MYWGHTLEPVIADEFVMRENKRLFDSGRFSIYRSKEWPWLFCTPDRIIEDYEPGIHVDKYNPGVLEIKTSGAYLAKEWDDQIPFAYQIQVQHQLAVTGYTWGAIAVLIGGRDFRTYEVERNEDFIAGLVEHCREFYVQIETGIQPTIDGSESTTRAIKALHPADDGQTAQLPTEAAEWHDKLLAAKQAEKQAKEEKALYENKLRAAIGSATFGELGEGLKYSLKTTEKKGWTVAPSTCRTLRHVKPK